MKGNRKLNRLRDSFLRWIDRDGGREKARGKKTKNSTGGVAGARKKTKIVGMRNFCEILKKKKEQKN